MVRTALLEQDAQTMQQIIPLSSAAALQQSEPAVIQSPQIPEHEKVMIRKNGIEIELSQNISETLLLTLLRGLREC